MRFLTHRKNHTNIVGDPTTTSYPNNEKGNVKPKSPKTWSIGRGRNLALILVVMVVIVVRVALDAILVPLPPLVLPQKEPWEVEGDAVEAIIYFRDASHSLVENVLNLISQGFRHVTLINNLSRQPLPMKELELLASKGYVTLTTDSAKCCGQKRAYFKSYAKLRFLNFQRGPPDWTMPVDADEFPMATQAGSLAKYLTLQDPEVCSIAMHWRLFGSSHLNEQPNSLIQGFTWRLNVTRHTPKGFFYKTAGRRQCMLWPAVHHVGRFDRFRLRGYTASHEFTNLEKPRNISQTEMVVPEALIYHYRVQSYKYYQDVTASRGDAVFSAVSRNNSTFAKNDYNDVQDTALAHRALQRFPALYDQGNMSSRPNMNYSSPWPMENIRQALKQLERHQTLAILDAAHTLLPDTLGRATRNAAILDPTWDCIARVPPGHAQSVMASKLLRLCAVRTAQPEIQAFADFVQATLQRYNHRYQGFVSIDNNVLLTPGADTSAMRLMAIKVAATEQPSAPPRPYEHGVDAGTIHLLPRPKAPTSP